ncbi:MAG: peptidase U32 family protein [Collinsella sp.]
MTVNIVIKDEEMSEALSLVDRCWRLGADAFIIQDWGLFFEIRRLMPEVETHISTQANIHDARGTAWCKEAGADRVTLSRELSIDEIAIIHDAVDIELEVFSHGAICFCYSGVCLLSSFTSRGRSANRGMCAQPCRLPYELIDETGRSWSKPGRERALCPRDTCTADMLPVCWMPGAHALKLEGRMKAPDYVHSIVSAYRAQLDDILARPRNLRRDRAGPLPPTQALLQSRFHLRVSGGSFGR